MRSVFVAVALLAAVALALDPPVFPPQYTITGSITIPTYPRTISEPFTIVTDLTNGRQLLNYYYGENIMITNVEVNATYVVNPRINGTFCWDMAGAALSSVVPVLPDTTNFTFLAASDSYCPPGASGPCNVFGENVTTLGVVASYYLVTDVNNVVAGIVLDGYDFIFGSHPDLYIIRIDSYVPTINASLFGEPLVCTNPETTVHDDESHRLAFLYKLKLGQLAMFTPASEMAATGDAEFDQFKAKYAKHDLHEAEHQQRHAIFRDNADMIARHNADASQTYTLGMNHLGDLTAEERKFLLHPSRSAKPDAGYTGTHVYSGLALPAQVDWVAKGAVNPPKDQGICGSCWTFGTAGSIEGAWAVKYGQLPSLAEQQLVDCAWSPNPNDPLGDQGCGGGFASSAMQWVIDNGGMAAEADYHYRMADGFCNPTDRTGNVKLTGYINVTSADENALAEAVFTYGPVAVAIDAAHPQFEFYQSGVYNNPACQNGIDDLDHEVLAVGYGTTPAGVDFWLVKNSWSDRWGYKGFIMMSRNNNNQCGIATQATSPLV